jgi:hypothetical protein
MRIFPDMTVEMVLKTSQTMRSVCAQGFVYMWRPHARDSVATDLALAEQTRVSMGAVPKMTEVWNSRYRPEIEALCKSLQDANYAGMSLQELASQMEGYVVDSTRTFVLTLLQAEMLNASRIKR